MKITCAALFAALLLSMTITTAGCDDIVWNRFDAPIQVKPLLSLGMMQSSHKKYSVTITVTGLTGVWDNLEISIDGEEFTLSSSTPLTINFRSLSEAISLPYVSQSPALYSCEVTGFTPDYTAYSLDITIACD